MTTRAVSEEMITSGRRAVVVALDELRPLTTRQIARLLRQLHCHGLRADAEQCPLARYVLVTTGLTVRVAPPFVFTSLWVERMPYSVASFAVEFDDGRFATLRGARRETP